MRTFKLNIVDSYKFKLVMDNFPTLLRTLWDLYMTFDFKSNPVTIAKSTAFIYISDICGVFNNKLSIKENTQFKIQSIHLLLLPSSMLKAKSFLDYKFELMTSPKILLNSAMEVVFDNKIIFQPEVHMYCPLSEHDDLLLSTMDIHILSNLDKKH